MSEPLASGGPAGGGPGVSVIIPTYRRAALVVEALASLQAQSFDSWEALVVDDDGDRSDNTAARVGALAADDPRVRYLPGRRRQGAGARRNQGLAAARADLVVFLDSDDALAPFCLGQRVDLMKGAGPGAAFAVFPCRLFDREPGDLDLLWNTEGGGDDDLDRFLAIDAPWQTAGVIWRREILELIGGWDETLGRWQDIDLHVRALAAGLPYRKGGRADCFWRREDPGRPSIGREAPTPEDIRARRRLLAKFTALLAAAGMLDEGGRRLHLAALHFRVADQARGLGARGEARAAWRLCRSAGLIPAWCHALGTLSLLTAGTPGLGGAAAALQRVLWPAALQPQISATLQKTRPAAAV